MTKKFRNISFLTAALISVAAFAANANAEDSKKSPEQRPTPGAHFIQHNDVDKDGSVSVDEVVQTAEEHFKKLDANSDGSVTPEEARAAMKHGPHRDGAKKNATAKDDAQKNDAKKHPRGPHRLDKLFELKDANKDGKLSQTEVERMPEKIFKEIDANSDGYLTAEEFEAHGKARMAEHGKKFFDMIDVTGDGKISVHEAIDAARRHFEKLDTDGNDIVTAEEAAKAHPPHARGPRGPRAAEAK